VANSLYTDKEVFVRELISNSSDALTKLRQMQVVGEADAALPLEIKIGCDEAAGTITICDTGVGMSKDELVANLGTIARSGSKAFIAELGDGSAEEDVGNSIIGRFGVGFYSAFMVSDQLTVYSRRAGSEEAFCWKSDGLGNYTIAPADNVDVGTKVVIALREKDKKDFGHSFKLRRLIEKYSNFVSFPISVSIRVVTTLRDAAATTLLLYQCSLAVIYPRTLPALQKALCRGYAHVVQRVPYDGRD
jgi:TNF receptor-associated protein 1